MTPTKQTPKASEKEEALTDLIDEQEDDDFQDEQENEKTDTVNHDPKAPDKIPKKPKIDIDPSLIHFKNNRNSSLSFIWPAGRLCTFTNGIFSTNDPETIKKMEQTQDFKFGFIKEFVPEKPKEKSK